MLLLKTLFFLICVGFVLGSVFAKARALFCLSVGAFCFAAFDIILFFAKLRLVPVVDYAIMLVILVALLVTAFITLAKYRVIVAIVAVSIALVFCVLTVFGEFFVNKTVDNVEYIGIGSKLTGVTETVVAYHQRTGGFFIASEPTFYENYGIFLGGYKDIANAEPLEVTFANGAK